MWLWIAGCTGTRPDPTEPVDRTDTVDTVDTVDTAPPIPSAWTDAPLESTSHGWGFRVDVDPDSRAEVRCTLDTDPEEVHVLQSEAPAATRDFVLYGLLADATYVCELVTDDLVEERTILTGPVADALPSWTTTGTADGYTLMNHGTDNRWARRSKLLIVDPEGRLRWSYRVPYQAADCDSQYLGDGRILYGGGYSAPPTIIGLSGIVEARAPASSTGFAYHHHAERIATGEIVTLTQAPVLDEPEWWTGFAIDILDPTLTARTWSWNSQLGYDAGWLPAGTSSGADSYHANSVQVLGDDVYVNLRHLSRVVKISRVTGERDWTLGPGGDFALLDETGAPASPADWFYMAHAPERTGDRVLLYDNGVGRPGGFYSRILELELDEAARTAQIVWSYTEPGWYEPIWGDVDRLPNGRVLFVRAHNAIGVPGLPDQRTEIVEIDPATDLVVWRMSFLDPHDAGYRAARIDGCTLFANTKYCAR